MRKIWVLMILVSISFPYLIHAADVAPEQITIAKAKVLEVISNREELVPGTDTKTPIQTIKVEILQGAEKYKTVTVDNDYLQLKAGDVFYLSKSIDSASGLAIYSVSDPYRLNSIYILLGLFILMVFVFGGFQGIRGLVSLAISLLAIFYILIPGINNGFSPILMSIGVSSLIIVLGSYITHGFNRTTTAAVVGMIVTVILTGILAFIAVKMTHLSGFESEEAVYLNFNSKGTINMQGLLLGGILIGVLGILYDVAIGQAISVEELYNIGPHLSRAFIYKRALRIGREHIGALVNTLAIAYVGVSLPLILFYFTTDTPTSIILNNGIFSTEIVRTLIGSMGLIMAVPITTLISVWYLVKNQPAVPDVSMVEEEKEEVINLKHHHH